MSTGRKYEKDRANACSRNRESKGFPDKKFDGKMTGAAPNANVITMR